MKLPNYSPWEINEANYPHSSSIETQIRFMLGYAILAPSTFNSQPWLCQIKSNKVLIFIDFQKMPHKSDKQGRFGYISVGCFIENLTVAAMSFGWNIETELNPQMGEDSQLVATVLYKEGDLNKINVASLQNLVQRTTNRSLSQEFKLTQNQKLEIMNGVEHGVGLHFIDNQHRSKIIAISQEADGKIWSDIEFRKEHVAWVRSNITRKPDGMPGYGVGVGLIPSLLSKPVILSKKFASMQAAKNKQALLYSPYYVVFTSPDTPQSWVAVGRSFQRQNVYLQSQQLSAAPMGQFIEEPGARAQLKDIMKSKQAPQLFMRISKPSQFVRHSPRRNVKEIVIN